MAVVHSCRYGKLVNQTQYRSVVFDIPNANNKKNKKAKEIKPILKRKYKRKEIFVFPKGISFQLGLVANSFFSVYRKIVCVSQFQLSNPTRRL